MAYEFDLTGGVTTTPLDGFTSLAPNVDSEISEAMVLARSPTAYEVDLTVDTPMPVQLGGNSSVNVVILKSVGGKVKARITSADGTTQAVPFDSVLIITSRSVPITAIDLTRAPATPCTVRVYLGQMA